MPNHLKNETSPYLLQHADNPVDWYPWGEEAFRRAREDDKPVFLSIGYSACHWCHVMARESFEDQETAELLNRWSRWTGRNGPTWTVFIWPSARRLPAAEAGPPACFSRRRSSPFLRGPISLSRGKAGW